MDKKEKISMTLISLIIAIVLCFQAHQDRHVEEPATKALEPTPVLEDYEVYSFPSVELVCMNEPSYTRQEHEILALIIYQEAGSDCVSDDTRLKVGNVFLNRVESSLFPDTFEEVATAKRQYGTLYWTGIKWPERASNPQEQKAVQRAYDIAQQLLEGQRVLPPNVIWQAEFIQGDGIYCYQDEIYFCYSEVK